MRARSIRRLAGVTATAALLGSAMLAAAPGVQAAPPNWVMTVVTLPGTVNPGATAGYEVTITNNGPSNISALYLTTKIGDQSGVAPVYVDDGVAGPGPCTDAGVPLECSFGALNAGAHVTITVAYTATGSGSFDPGFQGNTTGKTYTDPKRSHGDTLEPSLPYAGTTLSSDKNFGGAFNITFGGLVSNNANLTGQNKQSTKVGNLPAAAAATVLDGPNATGSCTTTSTIDCSKLFGEWSDVNVDNGGPYADPIAISITFKSGSPTAFLHVFDTGDQQLVTQCAGNTAPTATSQLPCFTWDGKNTATIYTLYNGSWRGL